VNNGNIFLLEKCYLITINPKKKLLFMPPSLVQRFRFQPFYIRYVIMPVAKICSYLA